MNQNSKVNENVPPMQFNTMLLESYDSTQNIQVEQFPNEEFSFPFSQELDIQLEKMFTCHNDNQNTYNLRSRKEPKKNRIIWALQPTPPNLRASNNPIPIRLVYGGQ